MLTIVIGAAELRQIVQGTIIKVIQFIKQNIHVITELLRTYVRTLVPEVFLLVHSRMYRTYREKLYVFRFSEVWV